MRLRTLFVGLLIALGSFQLAEARAKTPTTQTKVKTSKKYKAGKPKKFKGSKQKKFKKGKYKRNKVKTTVRHS